MDPSDAAGDAQAASPIAGGSVVARSVSGGLSTPHPAAGDRAVAAPAPVIPVVRARAHPVAARWSRFGVPALVLGVAFAVPLLVVPPTLPQPLIDDWNYQLSVRHLVEDGELWVAPWTATTLVLQVGWGAIFAWVFGLGPVALRASTLVACFGGVLACHALFREVGATRARALVGALAVWLNPVVFALSYTFMTDVPFLALVSAAAWATARGVRREDLGWLAAGSAFAGLAFLVRQQGVLLPLVAIGWLLLFGPVRFRAAPWRTAAAVLGPCAVAVAAYYRWRAVSGLPSTQEDYVQSVRDAGVWGTLDLLWRLGVVGLFVVGLFVLPLVLGAVRHLPTAWRRAGPVARHAVIVGLVGMAFWARWFAGEHNGRTFPFVPWGSILHEDGLGVLDADGTRPHLLPLWGYAAVATVCAFSVAAAAILVAGRDRVVTPGARLRSGGTAPLGGLLLALGLGQLAGAVPPSLHIRHVITFDRYYLPLLPFALGLVLWAVRGRRFVPAPAWALLALLAVVNVLGMQDWLAFKRGQWETAEWLVAEQGVPLRQVDGAVQWDGVHFYEDGLAHPKDRVARRSGDIWWLYVVAPMIDPVYIVAASDRPRDGYVVHATRPYDSWVRSDDEAQVYVWRRLSGAGPLPPRDITREVKSTAPRDQGSSVSPRDWGKLGNATTQAPTDAESTADGDGPR